MIRVYLSHPDGSMEHVHRAEDPAEAEAAYLRLIQERTRTAAAVIVDPGRLPEAIVTPARYRTDRRWPGPREEVSERYRQLWAPAGDWTGPTPWQLRGLVVAAGVSGSEIARRIGVTPRQWRRWLSDPDEGAGHHIPYAAWVAALRLTGMLPEEEHAAP